MILSLFAEAGSAIRFDQLGLSPIALDLGFFKLRWYSLAYIASILIGWWYLLKLIAQPGAPMARRHADDFVFYATLGIIVGGRLGYCLFYKPEIFLTPLDVFKLWEGGMSLHGGTLGTLIAIGWFTYRNKLSFLRFCDYIACATPFGLFFVRLANFVNGELWGRPTDVAWAMIFPATQDEIARHPSQLYEAGLEGLLSFAVLWLLFWKSDARYYPGRLFGMLALLYGSVRFGLEFLREPDEGVTGLLGLTMGQTLCIPMVLLGAYMIATSKARRERVESVAGTASIA